MITRLQEEARNTYTSAIGRPRQALVTPALILDLDVARQNIRTMAEWLARHQTKLRPHTKAQKSPQLARLQVEAGAIGICTATVWEAIAMTRSGIEDVLIANQVVGREKIEALARAAKSARLTVAVDDVRNAEDLSVALCTAGSQLEVLIEVDIGMGRGGVRSLNEAVRVAQRVSQLPGLKFRGIQGYEGHCMKTDDRDLRAQQCQAALDSLGTVVDGLREAGFACEVVSAGGTGTYDIAGLDSRVTEIQAGSYIFMDNFHGRLVEGFSNALTVLGTVVNQHGYTIVLDAGRKSISIDLALPTLKDYPFYQARYFAEEHALFDVDERCRLKLGDTTELIPGYAPSTVNMYDVYHVVEGGIVTDIWPVVPRGPGHAGLLSS